MTLFNTTVDLLLKPHPYGVQLVKPKKNSEIGLLSIDQLFSLPINVFFVSGDGERFIDMNETHFQAVIDLNDRFSTKTSLAGKHFSSVFKPESTDLLIDNNRKVIMANKTKIFEEIVTRLNKKDYYGISFKTPCLDQTNKIIGLFGLSTSYIPSGNSKVSTLAESLEIIMNTGLFSNQGRPLIKPNQIFSNKIAGVYVSKNEKTCLQLLMRGKTAKKIAADMHLSYRTVESYIAKLKLKFNVDSKSSLIEKMYNEVDIR